MSKIHQDLFQQFQSLDSFKLIAGEQQYEASIEEVKPLNSYTDDKQSFSLLFNVEGSVVEQQSLCELEAEGLERMPVFIVPTNQYDNKTQYEVIFN